jgi:hypothetical protein
MRFYRTVTLHTCTKNKDETPVDITCMRCLVAEKSRGSQAGGTTTSSPQLLATIRQQRLRTPPGQRCEALIQHFLAMIDSLLT